MAPEARATVRPARRLDDVLAPGSVLMLKLPELPPIVWDGLMLRCAGDVAPSPLARRILDETAHRLEAASLHIPLKAHPPTLVVVPEAASRIRFADWLSSAGAVDPSRVGCLVLNRVAQDPARAAAAVRQAVEFSASAEVVFVLRDAGRPDEVTEAGVWKGILSEVKLGTPVSVLRPTEGGYKTVERASTFPDVAATPRPVFPQSPRLVEVSQRPASQDEVGSKDATSVAEDESTLLDDIDADPTPWRF
jgi:hypothetical protein